MQSCISLSGRPNYPPLFFPLCNHWLWMSCQVGGKETSESEGMRRHHRNWKVFWDACVLVLALGQVLPAKLASANWAVAKDVPSSQLEGVLWLSWGQSCTINPRTARYISPALLLSPNPVLWSVSHYVWFFQMTWGKWNKKDYKKLGIDIGPSMNLEIFPNIRYNSQKCYIQAKETWAKHITSPNLFYHL